MSLRRAGVATAQCRCWVYHDPRERHVLRDAAQPLRRRSKPLIKLRDRERIRSKGLQLVYHVPGERTCLEIFAQNFGREELCGSFVITVPSASDKAAIKQDQSIGAPVNKLPMDTGPSHYWVFA